MQKTASNEQEVDLNRLCDLIKAVWQFYEPNGRHDMLWRQPEPNGLFDPYKIVVSELMLQQTQVSRVMPKYQAFISIFPTVARLAQVPLEEVLRAWSGLGYNRRAKFLWQSAQMIYQQYGGHIPQAFDELVQLPGIGPNTAGAILAYAFNQPVIFIETNIRTVFIHHMFSDHDLVSDAQLRPIIAEALQHIVQDKTKGHQPRNWYWALMDYGVYLKQSTGNAAARSKQFSRQSTFKGSRRQIRGEVLKYLAANVMTLTMLRAQLHDDRLEEVLQELQAEGLISVQQTGYRLGS